MRYFFIGLALLLSANQAISQVGAITKAIRGAEATSEAANAARAAKAGTKVVTAESVSSAVSGSEKFISPETTALIASRTTQIVSNCKATSSSKTKDLDCHKKSDEFQRCIASELEYTRHANTAVDRCTKLYE
jgi:hypothetical protein